MSELWICREQKAGRPFRIKAADVDVRTMEELCFYLYQSREFLDESVMGEELFAWLSEELELPRLAAALAEEQKQGKNALWCAYILLKESGMYAEEELAEIRALCLAMESKNEFELGKLRADRFLYYGKECSMTEESRKTGRVPCAEACIRSIREYERLIAQGEAGGCSRKLLGNIWHNLGVAHLGLFLFVEAAECFAKAYDLNQNDESLMAWQRANEAAGEQTDSECAVGEEPECGWDDYLSELKKMYRERG